MNTKYCLPMVEELPIVSRRVCHESVLKEGVSVELRPVEFAVELESCTRSERLQVSSDDYRQ